MRLILGRELGSEPSSRDSPVVLYGSWGDTDCLRCFFDIQSREISKFDDACMAFIEPFELAKEIIEGDEIHGVCCFA